MSSAAAASRPVPELLLRAEGLAVGYGAQPSLRDVTMEAMAGQRIGVIGPNGGGKTTLFRAILGELRPLAGTLDVRVRCGSVPQTQRSRLDYPVTALDVATMGALSRLPWWRRPGRAERRRALDALDEVGLRAEAGHSFGELSGGQQQRVLVARALVQDARLLLLDEPFTGVDEASSQRLMVLLDRLAAEGRAMLVATHDIEQARAWDLVLCLNRRQIAFGPPEEVLVPDVIAATYPGAVVVFSHEGHEPDGAGPGHVH